MGYNNSNFEKEEENLFGKFAINSKEFGNFIKEEINHL